MIYTRMAGTGSYLPEKVMTNEELSTLVDTSDKWIRERSGIGQRHIAAAGENTVDLAEHASRQALEAAGCKAEDLDLIVVATTTPDQVFPSSACLLQARLGNVGSPAFDIQAVCSGFVYALSVADQYIRSGTAKRVLVVGAETFTRILNWKDRTTCVLFGDGAGAVVLEASEEPGILSVHLHADGRYSDCLHVPQGVSQGYQAILEGRAWVEMKGPEVFKMAVAKMSEVVEEALEANGLKREDLDWLIPHQANIRIIKATARKLKMGMDKVVLTVEQHANTSAASIPLALDVAVRDGRVKRGQLLMLEAFGGGFTWGSALLRY